MHHLCFWIFKISLQLNSPSPPCPRLDEASLDPYPQMTRRPHETWEWRQSRNILKIYRHATSWSPDLFPGVHVEVVVVVILERILPYPDGLTVVVSGRVLETVRGDQDVVEELEADVDPFFAAVLDLAHDNLLQVGPEYEHPKLDSRVRGSITWIVDCGQFCLNSFCARKVIPSYPLYEDNIQACICLPGNTKDSPTSRMSYRLRHKPTLSSTLLASFLLSSSVSCSWNNPVQSPSFTWFIKHEFFTFALNR